MGILGSYDIPQCSSGEKLLFYRKKKLVQIAPVLLIVLQQQSKQGLKINETIFMPFEAPKFSLFISYFLIPLLEN